MKTLVSLLLSVVLSLLSVTVLADKTLVFCSEGSPSGFDPNQRNTSVDYDASSETIFNRLLQFERGQATLKPALSTHWKVSSDNLTYTFYLRKGVKFHTTEYFKPTRDFNADDVVFTFSRMLNPRHLFRLAYPAEFPLFTDLGLDKNIRQVFAVDPHTVKFILRKPDAVFVHNLALNFASIHSFEYAQQLYKNQQAFLINQKPIGTGPFIFKSYVKDQQIRYVGNQQYWDKSPTGKVKLDRLVFSITPDSAVRAQKLKRGECHVAVNLKPAEVVALKKAPSVKVLSQTGFNVGYLAYNVQKPPLNNRLVRQALDMALNKKAIVQAIYKGQAKMAINPLPPSQWGYNHKLNNAPYNPRLAKALLVKAGFAKGFSLKLFAMPIERPYNPNARLMAQMIQADWAKIGVKVTIITHEWGQYTKHAKQGEHDAMLYGWMGNADPDTWLGAFLSCGAVSGSNYTKWCHKPFDDLIVKAKTITNQKERIRLYEKAQAIVKEELPMSVLAHAVVHQPIRQEVVDFRIVLFGTNAFYGVGLE